ncbi:MAG: TonB-dependent receptor plug domain-containing protein [Betaproteobacteria bacterium]|nr:TonB-dependent receptor plug domain-containing protein [Betaproteobacteria bacterium]
MASSAFPALAHTDLTELSLEQLLNVDIVSASHFTQKVNEAPSAVTIIRNEEIRQYGWRNLAEVLNSVRGFQTTYDRYFHYAGIRGFLPPGDYNSRMLLMVDGYRTNDNVFDQASIGNEFVLDLDLVDHIEIVRGPSSPVYGGNAFFGAINVITKRGKDIGGGEIAASAGSFDTYKGRATFGKMLDNGMDIVLSYSGLNSIGQTLNFPEFNNPATNNGWASGADKGNFNKLFAKLGLGGFYLETAWSRRIKGLPTGAFGTVFNNPGTNITDEYGIVDARYTDYVGRGLEFTGRTFYGNYNYAGNYLIDNPPLPPTWIRLTAAGGGWRPKWWRRAGKATRGYWVWITSATSGRIKSTSMPVRPRNASPMHRLLPVSIPAHPAPASGCSRRMISTCARTSSSPPACVMTAPASPRSASIRAWGSSTSRDKPRC